jgi:hypothetical protein
MTSSRLSTRRTWRAGGCSARRTRCRSQASALGGGLPEPARRPPSRSAESAAAVAARASPSAIIRAKARNFWTCSSANALPATGSTAGRVLNRMTELTGTVLSMGLSVRASRMRANGFQWSARRPTRPRDSPVSIRSPAWALRKLASAWVAVSGLVAPASALARQAWVSARASRPGWPAASARGRLAARGSQVRAFQEKLAAD